MDNNYFPEKFLYHIWDAQHIRYSDYHSKILHTVSGKELKIHFAGHYNTMSGADFQNASIEINGTHLIGDIEIHINSSDWYHHQHDDNPAYNSVILHVVYHHNHHNDMTINEDNRQIEILEIKNLFTDEIEVLFKDYTENNFRTNEKYCKLFANIRPEFFEQFLIRSGLERLNKKVKRFTTELSFVSMDQLLYQSIFEALGYTKNKNQFYLYSKDNKWLTFKKLYDLSSQMSLERFIELLVEGADFENNKYHWYLFRVRPCNQPLTRIYQIAPFLYTSFATSLTTEIQSLFSFKKDEFNLKRFKARVYERLCAESSYTTYKMGKERINTIIINIFIPILIVYSALTNDDELAILCHQIYNDFSGLEEHHIDHIMRKYMTEDQYAFVQKKTIYQQGILNVYYLYCINNLCDICSLNAMK